MTAPTALILARVYGNSPEFWLNVQRRTDLWKAMNSQDERERIERARHIRAADRCGDGGLQGRRAHSTDMLGYRP